MPFDVRGRHGSVLLLTCVEERRVGSGKWKEWTDAGR